MILNELSYESYLVLVCLINQSYILVCFQLNQMAHSLSYFVLQNRLNNNRLAISKSIFLISDLIH